MNAKYPHSLAAVAVALTLSSCGGGGSGDPAASGESQTTPPPSAPAVEAVFLDAAPDGAALTVAEARQQFEPGTTVTVTGRIAGALQPFSDSYATIVLADDSLETCERIPGDSCETPWDACCVEPEKIAALRLAIQVVGDDGRPVAGSLKGTRGLAELDSLVVQGTVADGSTAENLILNATGIYRVGGLAE